MREISLDLKPLQVHIVIPMAKQPKVPFNCLLPAGTVEAIRKQADEDKCSQADVVHRAIALLCFGEEIRTAPITAAEISRGVEKVERQVNSGKARGMLLKPGGKLI